MLTHARGSANGRLPRFERGDEGSIPSPRILLPAARIRQLAERLGLNPSACGFDSHLSHWKSFVLVEQPGVLATLSRWRSWVQIPSGTLDNASACRHNHGPLVYRRRTPAPHAGRMGSTPIRATRYDQVVEPADTRRSERRAFGRGSSTLPLVTLYGRLSSLPLPKTGWKACPTQGGWSSPVVAHNH